MAKKQTPDPHDAANENAAVDQDALALEALAEGVLQREFRPRASSVRRLAEGVLALRADLKKARKKAKAAAPKTGKKKNKKLAKIPGQKTGQKKGK
ncbi:hypothetical protein [Aurantiacibacter gilvus]|uniref:Histone H1 n=1 Tax=Aurantiacibacter gilvus TaxID=3139141 RepID=A0ABU9IG48_9SPHN